MKDSTLSHSGFCAVNLQKIAEMASAIRESNVETMNKLEGFNVVIICCSSSLQAKYWQQRLEAGRGSVLPTNSIVLSVEEDWPGGAGNGD